MNLISALSFAPKPKVPPPSEPQSYEKWLYKNPVHPRTVYYNSILPTIYKDAYPVMQTKFENYFFKERMWRYELKEWKDKTEKKIQFYMDVSNPASYGKFTLPTFKSVSPAHIEQCGAGVQKLIEAIDHITEKVEELKVARDELYVGMTLKQGMAEKDEFFQKTIQDLNQMRESCTSPLKALETKLEAMKKANKGLTLPKDAYKKKKNKKNNTTKANSRKQIRLKKRIAALLEKIGKKDGEDINNVDVKNFHRRYDLNALKFLLHRGSFIGDAKLNVQKFLQEAEESDSDTSDSD